MEILSHNTKSWILGILILWIHIFVNRISHESGWRAINNTTAQSRLGAADRVFQGNPPIESPAVGGTPWISKLLLRVKLDPIPTPDSANNLCLNDCIGVIDPLD